MNIPQQLSALEETAGLFSLSTTQLDNINCHKLVLYLAKLIPFDELVSDPRQHESEDFMFRERALQISKKEFAAIHDKEGLLALARNQCDEDKVCIGQILDTEDRKLAHSFIIVRTGDQYICFDKVGFKEPFSTYQLSNLLSFENYAEQEWRFVPLTEAV